MVSLCGGWWGRGLAWGLVCAPLRCSIELGLVPSQGVVGGNNTLTWGHRYPYTHFLPALTLSPYCPLKRCWLVSVPPLAGKHVKQVYEAQPCRSLALWGPGLPCTPCHFMAEPLSML